MVENACFSELIKSYRSSYSINFWRTWDKIEVDFIIQREAGQLIPIEVKYQTLDKPHIFPSVKNFIKRYR